MRVILTHRSSIDRIGGVVTFILELSEALINMNHEVYIVDFSHSKSSKDLKELYDVEKIPPILSLKKYEAKDFWPPRGSSVKDLTIWLFRGSRIIRDLKPDIVIINGVVPLFKNLSSTYVAVAHMIHPHIPSSPFTRLILKSLYEANNYIVAITEREKRALIECLNVEKTKVKVIPLCLNTGKYKRKNLNDRDKILLHVGTHEAKNLPATLKTFSDLCMEFKDLDLVVAGSHVNEALMYTRELVKPECISRVHIRTFTKSELRDLYSRALVLIAPSRYEGFPYAALEAQASGTPVIASKAVPSEVIINNVTGYRIGNIELLSEYVRTLLYDRNLWMKMSLKAREHAENHDCRKIASKYLALCRES